MNPTIGRKLRIISHATVRDGFRFSSTIRNAIRKTDSENKKVRYGSIVRQKEAALSFGAVTNETADGIDPSNNIHVIVHQPYV
jgi:hypothetical protein